jgi:hypothetical protein
MYPTVIIENFIKEDTLNLIESSFFNLDFELGPFEKEVTNSTLRGYFVDQNFVYYDFMKVIDDKIDKHIKAHYPKQFELCSGQVIVRYMKNQFIKKHIDWHYETESDILNKKKTIYLSSVFYFNDNYSGGDLVFYNDNKEKYFSIKPKKNCLILFDALQVHSTIPIISGTKYSYTNFYTLKD